MKVWANGVENKDIINNYTIYNIENVKVYINKEILFLEDEIVIDYKKFLMFENLFQKGCYAM